MARWTVAYHHGNLPAALLDAVESAIAEHGVSALTLRDVARRAGVSHSAPAHHFGGKAGLLTAFATAGYRLLAELMTREVAEAGTDDPAASAAAMGRGYVHFAITRPAHFEVMYRLDALNPADPGLVQARETVAGLLAAAIERCAAAGRLHGRPAGTVFIAAWSLAHGLATLGISGRLTERGGGHEPQQLAAAALDMFVQAVLPAPPPPGQTVRPDPRPPRR
jgi:AcrR family transcriptional regulator